MQEINCPRKHDIIISFILMLECESSFDCRDIRYISSTEQSKKVDAAWMGAGAIWLIPQHIWCTKRK